MSTTDNEMSALLFTEPGPSDVLHVVRIPRPEPAAGQVRVRVTVSGVNPSDWKSRAKGVHKIAEGGQIPHHDGVGTIDAVGEGVSEERIGERVWLHHAAWQRKWGTSAQWSVVPAENAVPLPEGVPDDVGAGLGVPAITAHRLLGDIAALKGASVLVRGFGAVGFAATHLARWAGANVVVTTADPEKQKAAQKAGASVVIDRTAPDALEQLKAALPDGAQTIVEVSLGAHLAEDVAVLTQGGRIGVYGMEGPKLTELPGMPLINKNARIEFVMMYLLPPDAIAAASRDITSALEQGYLRGRPTLHFSLEDGGKAHDAGSAGEQAKILIDIP
ncbi:NADPH:quinone reductase [Pseudonocardia dioxanivorans]|uniref:NADPH:quinone reductase n=1 Tax=Pseudonocardia dioxanivorans TaxID=240495 RepID=UPI000CD2E09E|nr:NADPH:quinone reductase [Pseudonocardia dioxanivorans]